MTHSLVKGMSQWSNRFHVLSDEISDACSALHQSESHGSVGTMSNLPSPSIESLVHSELAVPVELKPSPPAKIFIRSARVKVSTQLDVQLQTLDTGSKVTVTALLDSGATGVRATLHWEQDYPRNREGYCFNPEGLFQPAEQRTEEQGKRVVFQLRGLTGIVSTWTHRERDNRQVERERGETQRVVDKE